MKKGENSTRLNEPLAPLTEGLLAAAVGFYSVATSVLPPRVTPAPSSTTDDLFRNASFSSDEGDVMTEKGWSLLSPP